MAVGVTQSSAAARVKLRCLAAASNARKAFNGIYVRMPGLRSMPTLLDPRRSLFSLQACTKRANERAQIFRKSAPKR
jgi:hypothetical protein